jgi:hypothetical protein
LIQWPNWTGIFDDQGDQRSRLGVVVPQDMALSTPAEEFSPSPIALFTNDTFSMKALDEVLTDPKDSGYFLGSPVLKGSTTESPLSDMSNRSERGSDVPDLNTDLRSAPSHISMSEDTVPVVVDGADDTLSKTSTSGSFEHMSLQEALNMDPTDEVGPATTNKDKLSDPKKPGFAHKVRRSFDWLTRSSN